MVKHAAEKLLTPILRQMNPKLQRVSDTLADFNVVPYQSTHICGGTVMGAER